MRFGLFGLNMRPCHRPEALLAVAHAAERGGYDSMWGGEHLVLADPQTAPSPLPPTTEFVDLTAAIAFAAAQTRTLRFATGIMILPLRNPVILAKQIASLDVMSGGRIILGVGIGNIELEFKSVGMPFDHKGPRAEEALAVMKALWTMDQPRFEGRFFSLTGVRAEPRPVQKPHPPIIFGGKSAYAFSRTARLGLGWFGYGLDREASANCINGIRSACTRHHRNFGEIEISIAPKGRLDFDLARRYEDLGVARLVLSPRARTAEEMIQTAEETANQIIARF